MKARVVIMALVVVVMLVTCATATEYSCTIERQETNTGEHESDSTAWIVLVPIDEEDGELKENYEADTKEWQDEPTDEWNDKPSDEWYWDESDDESDDDYDLEAERAYVKEGKEKLGEIRIRIDSEIDENGNIKIVGCHTGLLAEDD